MKLRLPLIPRFLIGILAILALSLWLFNWLMKPPGTDIGLMALLLAATALVSALVSFGLYRLGWLERSPTIYWTLLGGYALSSLLTFLNVWFAAQQMFASPHDLMLALVLLVFAGGMAMVLGYFLSSALTVRIRRMQQAARQLAAGDLEVRVPVSGRDEMAELARSFNQMAAGLEAASRQQQELDMLRRDLIAWVSHDLQTPLASIRLILEALADGVVEDGETVQRYLGTAQREVRSLSSLIDDLFQMAQLDAGGLSLERAPVSLADMISDTIESFTQQATQNGVQLLGSIEQGIDLVTIDAARIGRVLNNLVSNALRHTLTGGVVQVSAKRTAYGVLVEVCDSGEGIPAGELPHIFERFYRGEKSRSRQTGGAGLGLAIARSIIEAHGGSIQARSQPGETCLAFTLPLE